MQKRVQRPRDFVLLVVVPASPSMSGAFVIISGVNVGCAAKGVCVVRGERLGLISA